MVRDARQAPHTKRARLARSTACRGRRCSLLLAHRVQIAESREAWEDGSKRLVDVLGY